MSARVAPQKRRNGLALPIDHLLRSKETLGKRMPSAPGDGNRPQAPASSENERCPRCDSLDTKFCYYNNYNLAQPRHFCKSCRRYWTLGGTLRNVPMGGATHKKSSSSSSSSRSKRRRPSSGSPPSSTSSSADPATISATRTPSAPPSLEPADDSATNDVAGSFGSLLTEPLPTGFLALGEPFFQGRGGFDLGLGLGLGSAGFEEMGFGLGRTVWPFLGDEEEEVNDDALGGEAGDGEADCFAWPELGISSTQGKGLQ